MVISLLPKTSAQRIEGHHFAYPTVRPVPRPEAQPVASRAW